MKQFSKHTYHRVATQFATEPDVFLLDNQDLLLRMHVTRGTLQRWRRKGLLPYYKIGRKIYYRESEFSELLKKHKKP